MLYLLAEVYMYLFKNIDGNSDLGLYRFFEEHFTGNLIPAPEFIIISMLLLIVFISAGAIIGRLGRAIGPKMFIKDRDGELFVNSMLVMTVLAIICGGFFIRGKVVGTIADQKEILALRSSFDKEKTVIHAAGYVEAGGVQYDYTNTYDALTSCYDAGNRFVEIDFKFSTDGKLICAHEGSDNTWAEGIDSDGPISEEAFLNAKFEGALTTMGLTQLADYMRSHEDLYIVTDCKAMENLRSCGYIAAKCPDLLDRFVVQIYHAKDYNDIRKLGFKNIILTLYKTKEYERTPDALLKDIREYDLIGITFWEKWMSEDFFKPLLDEGNVLLLVHTVNDINDIKRDVETGVLVYTDNVDNDWLR